MREELPVIDFMDQNDFHQWLDENHNQSGGIWLKIAKKKSEMQGVSYDEALDEAICYGWIDGQKKGLDDAFWLQRFSPRKKNSVWSNNNKEKALALIEKGRMQPSGLAVIEDSKKTGAWERAYDSQSKIQIPPEFKKLLEQNPEAEEFFKSLDSLNRYAILFRIQKQKTEQGRARKMEEFLQMLSEKRKIYA